jgi:hypothetical protein
MADCGQRPAGDSKRYFDDSLEDEEMREFFEVSQSAKKARLEVATPSSGEVTFDEFLQHVEDPDMRAVLQMSPPAEILRSGPNDRAPVEVLTSRENGDSLGEPVLNTKRWSDELEHHLKELEGLGPAGMADSEFLRGFSDDEFLAQHKSFVLSGGVPNSQADMMEVDEFPALPNLDEMASPDFQSISPKTFRLPKFTQERKSTIWPSLIEPTDSGLGKNMLNERNLRNGSEGPQQTTGSGRTERTVEVAGFPPAADPLPDGLTLEQICWSYPNHLCGYHLRPFLVRGWTSRKIWNSMQGAARQSASRRQPWNKMTARMTRERKRMEAETRGTLEAATTISESRSVTADDDTSFTGIHESQPILAAFSHTLNAKFSETRQFLPIDEAPALPQNPASFGGPGPALVCDDIDSLNRILHLELLKQATIISETLRRQDPDWAVMNKEDQQSRVRDSWLACAREHEERFAGDNSINVEILTSGRETQDGMLKRLREMLNRSLVARNRPRNDMSTDELQTLQETQELQALANELLVVQDWTEQLNQRLEAAGQKNPSTPDPQLFPVADDGEAPRLRRRGNGSPSPDPDSPDLAQFARSDDLQQPSTAGQQNLRVEMSDAGQDGKITSSTPPSKRHLRSAEARNTRRYGHTGIERISTGRPGAPRIRMFPDFPSRDVPLTEQDIADLDNILDRFPEHLTVHSVMLRFCSPEGSKKGSGYPTKKMVELLLKHRNANDAFILDEAERERTLHHWVAAQKASANVARRGGRKDSSTPK